MKNKLLSLAIISVMALSLVACGGSDTKVIESDSSISSDTASSDSNTSTGYVFSYNGIDMPVDSDVAPIIEALGDPDEYFESPSCAADGIGKLYTYSDFQIQTYPDGDQDLILYVLLRTDNVATAEGIDLSSSKDDIIAAYGEATTESSSALQYEKDGMTLQFLFDGDSLISIEYDSSMN